MLSSGEMNINDGEAQPLLDKVPSKPTKAVTVTNKLLKSLGAGICIALLVASCKCLHNINHQPFTVYLVRLHVYPVLAMYDYMCILCLLCKLTFPTCSRGYNG